MLDGNVTSRYDSAVAVLLAPVDVVEPLRTPQRSPVRGGERLRLAVARSARHPDGLPVDVRERVGLTDLRPNGAEPAGFVASERPRLPVVALCRRSVASVADVAPVDVVEPRL